MANAQQIELAIKAGASVLTHLGNAVPLSMPRHPNFLWDLLAAEELYSCIITDGLHIPDSFIKVVMKNKGDKTLLASDATRFAGMQPGEYQDHIGGVVVLDEEKRVSLKSTAGLMAGAAMLLLENVETLMDHQLSTLGAAWKMASVNVANMLKTNDPDFDDKKDFVLFRLDGKKIQIKAVIKQGNVFFDRVSAPGNEM